MNQDQPKDPKALAQTSEVFNHYLPLLAAALFAAMYFITALPRIFYPYDLDFIEDSILMQAWRFAQGQIVYGPPTADFIPHVYMPVYMWLGGGLINLFGLSLMPLRLLSFAATLATTGLVFYITRRESNQTWLAWVCAGLYLGGYRLSGFWYELARVDSLFVALSLGGLTLGIYVNGSVSKRIAAIFLLVLAFFTKQTALAFGACLIFYWWFEQRWQVLKWVALYAGLGLGAFYLVDQSTQHWFTYYVFNSAAGDPVEAGRVFRYIGLELFGVMLGLSALGVATGWQVGRRFGVGGLRREGWLLALGAAVVISGAGRASVGGNLNNLMPVYALLCLTPALFWKAWITESDWKRVAIATAVLIQFALGVYNPQRYIPTAEMQASGDRLVERIRSIKGEVLVLMHPYYAVLAGKAPSVQIIFIWYDFYWQGRPPPPDLTARIQTRYYTAIISDESVFEIDPLIQQLLLDHYVVSEKLPLDESPLSPVGLAVRPTLIYIPK